MMGGTSDIIKHQEELDKVLLMLTNHQNKVKKSKLSHTRDSAIKPLLNGLSCSVSSVIEWMQQRETIRGRICTIKLELDFETKPVVEHHQELLMLPKEKLIDNESEIKQNNELPDVEQTRGVIEDHNALTQDNTSLAQRKSKPFECEECGKAFAMPVYLRQHRRTHIDENDLEKATLKRPYECDICKKRFVQSSGLYVHRRTHSDNVEVSKPYKCDECGKRFSSNVGLQGHVRTHLPVSELVKFHCTICDKGFKYKGQLYEHGKMHRATEKARKPHQCEVCEKRFRVKNQLAHHKVVHLPDAISRTFQCDLCPVRLKTKGDLAKHKRTHLEDEAARLPHKCDECGKRLCSLTNLKVHKRTHLMDKDPNKRIYNCKTCGKSFADPSAFRTHRRMHEDDEEKRRPFKCEECGDRFGQSGALTRHKQMHHLDDADPEALKRPHRCDVCGKLFIRSGDLIAHSVKHDSTLAQYECKICGNKYIGQSRLTKHHKKFHPDIHWPRKRPVRASTNCKNKKPKDECDGDT